MKQNFRFEGDCVLVEISKSMYPKEVLIQASYVLLETYYILLDEKERYYEVSLKPKEEGRKANEKDVYALFDELIESHSYLDQLRRSSGLREVILERALLTQNLDLEDSEKKQE
ncbi:hypothetical protein H6501_03710 [Candidatus Woesearchaeota archaeon]|nr:hypothetical protein [Nanoarchaeota archaeon]MCB9370677.1 hypothetical protein [Candidatus Woesearchaeota archaeon]USN43761.1 MAG: hypothetical protein H6500_05210 [Candidatus Woesearchaeota archaeon]